MVSQSIASEVANLQRCGHGGPPDAEAQLGQVGTTKPWILPRRSERGPPTARLLTKTRSCRMPLQCLPWPAGDL
jgi:hypothetical protein